jgi:antitoxin (DNA-binding transcriptional repressor) of toxin-antitoxin stability system
MEQIAISKFKATCLAVLEQVRRTGKPVSITRRGQVVAEINPPQAEPVEGERKLGWARGEILGSDEELVNASGWDEEDEAAWDAKWDRRLGLGEKSAPSSPAPKRGKR